MARCFVGMVAGLLFVIVAITAYRHVRTYEIGHWEITVESDNNSVPYPASFGFDGHHAYVYYSTRRISDKGGWYKQKAKWVGNDLHFLDVNRGWQYLVSYDAIRMRFFLKEDNVTRHYERSSFDAWLSSIQVNPEPE